MGFQRSRRLGELIHKEISALLVKGIKDPRIDFVTITGVEMTPDMHLVRVYYTAMGDETAKKECAKGLKKAVPYIRRELGRRLHARYIPDLLFEPDSALEYGNRIEALLREVQAKDDDESGTP